MQLNILIHKGEFLAIPIDLMRGSSKMKSIDQFGICTATLDGENINVIISNSTQEMTHARVSPDKEWITFTRYNKIGKMGLATENTTEGFKDTEVMIVRMDGSGLKTLTPYKEGIVSCNSYWTPDGSLLYVSTDNPERKPEIRRIDLDADMEIQRITVLPVPENLLPVDPHQVDDLIVFPAVDVSTLVRGIWVMKTDGSDLRQITVPIDPETNKPVSMRQDKFNGDNDPKLSPDCSKVAFMRHVGGRYHWHIFVVDVETGEEEDLSEEYIPRGYNAADAMPEWSSDGDLLVFWYLDLENGRTDLYRTKPDGSEREIIPLPEEYNYKMPAFFPGEGSGKDARIIFCTRRRSITIT